MADREDIAYLSDINRVVRVSPGTTVTQGNIPVFGQSGTEISDSHISASDIVDNDRLASEIESAVSGAASEIWSAIRNVEVLQAYNAPQWSSESSYGVGDYCMYEEVGYRCKSASSPKDHFDYSDWDIVLDYDGKKAIDKLLERYSDVARLSDLAPMFDPASSYDVGDLVIKINSQGAYVLQVCTVSGLGGGSAQFSEDATIEGAIARLDKKIEDHEDDDEIHVSSSDRESWNGKQDEISDLDDIRTDAEAGASAAGRDKITISGNGQVTASHPDGTGAVPLATMSDVQHDAYAYEIKDLVPVYDQDDTKVAYQLIDHAVNIISYIVPDGKKIKLKAPSRPDAENACRDFYVVVDITSGSDVEMIAESMSLTDYSGENISLTAPNGTRSTYRFTEASETGSVFVVTLYADPAYRKVMELERALDAMLEDGGYVPGTPDFVPSVYLYDEEGHMYHKATAVRDPDTGDWNIAVDNDGVDRGPQIFEQGATEDDNEGSSSLEG